MHEMSLAVSVIDSLKEARPEVTDTSRKLLVTVGIGEFAQVVDHALEFALEILGGEYGLPHIKWKLETMEGRCSCSECGRDVEPSEVPWRTELRYAPSACPDCGGPVRVDEGMGLAVLTMEDLPEEEAEKMDDGVTSSENDTGPSSENDSVPPPRNDTGPSSENETGPRPEY